MGKQGPCHHCGVKSTPLWRNGPPEKPVLCNACGSRWRTKGTLTNYTPLHSREALDVEEPKVSKLKSISFKTKEQKSQKRKHGNNNVEPEHEIMDSDPNLGRVLEEDTSNRSSSGSAISYSESCSHLGAPDASDLTGSAQSNAWDSLVPSRKRTCTIRTKPSSVEKLTKDLHFILHQQSSYFSGSSEEDLLYESETPMGSLEIGYGGVLIRHPNAAHLEEESEASSLPIDNKSYVANEVYSGSSSLSLHTGNQGTNIFNVGNEAKRGQVAQDHIKRDELSNERFHILQSRDSPLSHVDMKDVISFEQFKRYLTCEEQQQLMKYLPSIDVSKFPDGLSSMFHSHQFMENLSYFQQLLLEGIFDLTSSEVNVDECRVLKRLVMLNLTKSEWVQHYRKFKDVKCNEIVRGEETSAEANFLSSSISMSAKRPHDDQIWNFPEPKNSTKSSKISCKLGGVNLSIKSQSNPSKFGTKFASDTNGYMESESNDISGFSPRSFFASLPERSSILDSLQFNDDQALLLDVPPTAPYPEAELLCTPWKPNAVLKSLSAESGVESLSNRPTSSSSCQQPEHWG